MKIQRVEGDEQGLINIFYSKEDWDRWNELGKKDGNVGALLVAIDYKNNFRIFKSYGTIENPFTDRINISMQNDDLFDGKLPTVEELLNPKPVKPATESFRIVFLDLSK